MLRTRVNDLKMGWKNEDDCLAKLEYNFCEKYGEKKLRKQTNQFSKWDWEGDTNGTHFEMKSRRNTKDCYPTTIIPTHKVMATDKKQVFIFHFTDKTCYIEYDEELFSTFAITNRTTWRDGKYDVPVPHYDIPISALNDLEEIPL
jgi:hypothetical protein